jgi:tetratricopeptide (TPR) repeat protein
MTTLHNYLQQITQLLNSSQFDVASHHCRYILQQYPRHLDTYRTLGKSYLEQYRLSEAVDIFQRVLSSDPNDFTAHLGLAAAYKGESLYPNAVWHMERAYEMEPYNPVVREELLELYQANGDKEPEHFGLTRGALAHLSLKGELYEQAIAELRQLLEEEPDRIDLEMLLVEALWHANQRIEVNERCMRIVEDMPYCLVANALLAHIWLQNSRFEEARLYLLRIQELMQLDQATVDPETIVGRAFTYADSPELPQRVEIEPLSELALPEEADMVQSEVDWMDETGGEGEPTYDWLSEAFAQELSPLAADGEEELEMLPVDANLVSDQEEESDWFFDDAAAAETAVADEDADWLAEIGDDIEEADVIVEDSDWLIGDEETAAAPSPAELAAQVEAEVTAEEAPDWLDLNDDYFAPEQLEPDLVGDWVSGVSDDDWLDQLDDSQAGIAAGILPTEDDSKDDSELTADWLTAEPALPFDSEDTLSFADDSTTGSAEDLPESDDEEEPLDWLMTGPPHTPAEEAAEADIEEEALDWLMTGPLRAEDADEAVADDWVEPDAEGVPDWLMTGPLEVPVEAGLIDDDGSDDDDWTGVDADGVPDWLMTGPLDVSMEDEPATEAQLLPDEDVDDMDKHPSDDDTRISTDELFDGWDGLDELAKAEETPDIIDSWLLRMTEPDDADDGADVSWLAEDELPDEVETLGSISAEGMVEEASAENLPDWLLHHDPETEAVDDFDTSHLDDLVGISTSELTGDDPGQIPDWMVLDNTDLLGETAMESTADTADSDDLFELTDDELFDEPEDELEDEDQIDDWLPVPDEAMPDELIQSSDEVQDMAHDDVRDVAQLDTDELIGEEEMLNLPDWLMQTDSDLLVGSDFTEEEESAVELSTDDILLEEDQEPLPDWMIHSVIDNLGDLLVTVDDADELPEIKTEDLLTDEEEQGWTGLLSRLHPGDSSELVAPSTEMEDAVIGDHDEVDNGLDEFPGDELDQTPEELDETIDWLDQFDEPSATADESEVEPIPGEMLPDWLDALAPDLGDEGAPDTLLMEDFAELPEAQESPDDLLEWLQADEPEAAEPEVVEPVPDGPVPAAETGVDAADTMAWLDDEGEDSALDWLSEMELEAESEELAETEETAVTTQDWLGEEELEVAEELEDAMAWLDQLAATEDDSLDELTAVPDDADDLAFQEPAPAVSTGISVEPEEEEDLEDALKWLATLSDMPDESEAEEIRVTAGDAEEIAADQEPDDLDNLLDKLEQQALATLPDDLLLDLADDAALLTDEVAVPATSLTDALDWLEQTALAPSVLIEEEAETAVTAETDDFALDEFEDDPTLFDEPDELELAEFAVETITAEEMVVTDFTEADKPEEPAAIEDDVDTLALDEVPDDPDEVMAWLEKLAARQGASLDELPSVSDEDAAAIAQMPLPPEPEPEETAVSEADFSAEIPEDPDEAMAWLEQLAARQGASLDELPSVDPDTAPAVLPPEAREALEDLTELEDLTKLADLEESEDLAESWSDFSAAFAENILDDADLGLDAALDEYEDEADMVDWLEEEDESVPGQTDWLTPLDDDLDPTSWLEAEEAASSGSESYESKLSAEIESLTDIEVPRAPEPAPAPDTEPLLADLDLDALGDDLDSSTFELDEALLAEAREKLSDGDVNDALYTYQSLVQEGRGLSMLIGDLETAVAGRRQPLLQRVLGDAYMRNGQLQKALDTYREALDAL